MASSHKQLSSQTDAEKAPLFAIQALVHGMAAHSVKSSPEEDRDFRSRLNRISEAVSDEPSWLDAMSLAERVVTTMRDHADRANKYNRSYLCELHDVIRMLIGTLEDLAIAGPNRMRDLQEIEKKLATAPNPDATRESKLRLSQCLDQIREEAMRHKQFAGAHGFQDPVTGLDGRPAAEAALAEACAGDNPVCAAIVLVDRIPLYNRRYGREVGDKVLRFFVELVQRSFEPGLALFRWTGPAVLLLRRGSPDGVQAEMRRAFDPRLDFEVDSGSRSILLTIGVSWSVVPMMVDPRLVVNKIDAFVTD